MAEFSEPWVIGNVMTPLAVSAAGATAVVFVPIVLPRLLFRLDQTFEDHVMVSVPLVALTV